MSNRAAARQRARSLAGQYSAQGDHTGWFEALYTEAGGDPTAIPWADMQPNMHLIAWLEREHIDGHGKTAVVVGCGLGDDAEALAKLGFAVMAFDISTTAIAWCKRRYPQTAVNYVAADLFNLPDDWHFDFVAESYTVQALPLDLRERAIRAVTQLVAPGGTLLAIGRLVAPDAERPGVPWPLTKPELDGFQRAGLTEIHFEDYLDDENPPMHRFRAEYRSSQ